MTKRACPSKETGQPVRWFELTEQHDNTVADYIKSGRQEARRGVCLRAPWIATKHHDGQGSYDSKLSPVGLPVGLDAHCSGPIRLSADPRQTLITDRRSIRSVQYRRPFREVPVGPNCYNFMAGLENTAAGGERGTGTHLCAAFFFKGGDQKRRSQLKRTRMVL